MLPTVTTSIMFVTAVVLASATCRAENGLVPVKESVIAGWVENGWIGEPPIRFRVKLDSGARTSSVNAPAYRVFNRNETIYVRFTLANGEGQSIAIEKPIIRRVKIRRTGTQDQVRPVVRLKICMAGIRSEAEFTLVDRADMNYPALIGRSFLSGRILINPGATFLASGRCGS